MTHKMSSIMEKNEATINDWMEKQRQSRQAEETPKPVEVPKRSLASVTVEPSYRNGTGIPMEAFKRTEAGVPKFTSQLNSEEVVQEKYKQFTSQLN